MTYIYSRNIQNNFLGVTPRRRSGRVSVTDDDETQIFQVIV